MMYRIFLLLILAAILSSTALAQNGQQQDRERRPLQDKRSPDKRQRDRQQDDTRRDANRPLDLGQPENDANRTREPNMPDDINVPEDANRAEQLDFNEPRHRDLTHEELRFPLNRLHANSSNVIDLWTTARDDAEMVRLAGAVQQQITQELNLLRALAQDEGAEKTAEAIDEIIKDRRLRYMNLRRDIRRGVGIDDRQDERQGREQIPPERREALRQRRQERPRDRQPRERQQRPRRREPRQRQPGQDEDTFPDY